MNRKKINGALQKQKKVRWSKYGFKPSHSTPLVAFTGDMKDKDINPIKDLVSGSMEILQKELKPRAKF